MNTASTQTTKGRPVKNFTWSAYACGPLVAKALEMKCSVRKAPTGIIPLSECNRRHRNERPSPARKGGTPSEILAAAGDPVASEGLAVEEDIYECSLLKETKIRMEQSAKPNPALSFPARKQV